VNRIPPAGETARGEACPQADRPVQPSPSDPWVLAAMLPHKLAPGEILVLSIGSGNVLTATNLHGRLALERHPLPE
jgi:hypothetical protein